MANRTVLPEAHDNSFEKDAGRLLALKSSVDAISTQIKISNERRRRKDIKVKEEHEQRRKDLLADGKNPYEVWRREEMDANKERQMGKLKAATELRNEKLLEQLMGEDDRYQKKKQDERQKRDEVERFQKEVTKEADKKLASYIRKMTDRHDVIDPTGTAVRIDPSKVSVQKTGGFGLGRARPTEIDKVQRDVAAASSKVAKLRPTAGSFELVVDVPQESASSSSSPPRMIPLVTNQSLAGKKETMSGSKELDGKQWKGDAFSVKPGVIAFDDFEVGKKYKQVVEVTNVALTMKFNEFKLLPLEDEVKDFFDIIFEPPGRMSPGMMTRITVWFNPKVNADIESTLPILAMTGRIDVPISCKIKRTVLKFSPWDGQHGQPIIDFGKVSLGESEQRVLTVKNAGALPARYSLKSSETEDALMVTWAPELGEFPAYSATKLTFTVTPTATGKFATLFNLSHGSLGNEELVHNKHVLVKGECLDVPIYLDQDSYDLQMCVFGHIFRESVVVKNRRSVAMKIEVERPRQIPEELQINPTLAYIQGQGQQTVQVRFSPKEDFLQRNPQFRDSQSEHEGAFRIPVRVTAAEQLLPAEACLVGRLTTDRIAFEPASIKFGNCFVGSSVTARLVVENESHLPQKFAFSRLPSCIAVLDVPDDVLKEEQKEGTPVAVVEGGGFGGLGTLLPLEKRSLSLAYLPDAPMELDCKLSFKAVCGGLCSRDFSLECKGQGASPPVTFSHSHLDLSSVPCGSSSRESIVVKNVSKATCTVALLLPPLAVSALRATPVCCTLQSGEARRVQFTFTPTKEYLGCLDPGVEKSEGVTEAANGDVPDHAATAAVADKELSHRLREIRANGGRRWKNEEEHSVHATWKLAFCIRSQVADSYMYINLRTCVLRNSLSVNPCILDFGEVPAQERRLMEIELESSEEHDLRIEPLPENQCFTVLSAARPFGCGRPLKLVIEFRPQLVQIFQAALQLRSQRTQVQVPLRGKGVRPVLQIEPEDGILHLGAVTFGKDRKDYITAQFLVKNASPFELPYTLDTVIAAELNETGAPPFTLSPAVGSVEANSQKVVTVIFRPHRPLGMFRQKVLVNVPNQKEPTFVYLFGHCFEYQAYAIPGLPFTSFDSTQLEPSYAFLNALCVGYGLGNSAKSDHRYPKAQHKEFALEFERGEKLKPLHLILGACVPPGTPLAPQNSSAASFRFEILPSEFSNLFTLEAPEGGKVDAKVEGPLLPCSAKKLVADARPEKHVKVIFRYNPPKESNLSYGGVNLGFLGGLGQWITCKVKGYLNGGYIPPGEASNQEIVVTLKAYLQQI